MKYTLIFCALLSGCTAANRHWSETDAWAADLTYYQFCVQSAITAPDSSKGSLLLNELRRRQARGSFDLENCATVGSAKAREIAEFKASTDAFFRGVGTVIGVGLAVGVAGAVGYYGGTAPATVYIPPQPARQPVPPPIPYVPSYGLLSATPSTTPEAGYFMTTCRYIASPTVIRVQTGTPCPPTVPQ